jgi:hypothetical protein
MKSLSNSNYWGWINHLSFYEKNILPSFSKEDFNALIKCFQNAPDIDYNGESLLTPVAKNQPRNLIKLLHKRLKQSTDIWELGFRAIPFEFYYLNKSLREQGEITVNEIFKWFKDEKLWFAASHLLRNIFKDIDMPLENKLMSLIKSNNIKNHQIVFSVLAAYDGKETINDLCKKIINSKPKDYVLWDKVMNIMSEMGTVSGEYGFVDALIKKKENIQGWKIDNSKVIQEFSLKYEAYLDEKIPAYRSSADEDIMIRKREFDN